MLQLVCSEERKKERKWDVFIYFRYDSTRITFILLMNQHGLVSQWDCILDRKYLGCRILADAESYIPCFSLSQVQRESYHEPVSQGWQYHCVISNLFPQRPKLQLTTNGEPILYELINLSALALKYLERTHIIPAHLKMIFALKVTFHIDRKQESSKKRRQTGYVIIAHTFCIRTLSSLREPRMAPYSI